MSNETPGSKPCCPADCAANLGDLLSPRFFKALGDANRIALLVRLAGCGCEEPHTVSEIACCCPVDLSVASRHLAILREAGIVEAQKRGKEVHYSVRYDVLARTFRQIADAIESCCPQPPHSSLKETTT